jgi:hypothetical protein
MKFTNINIGTDVSMGEYQNKKIKIDPPLKFQIPRMYMPFGISGFTPEIGQTKWNIDFAMNGWCQEDNYVKKFFDFIKNLEKHILNHDFIKTLNQNSFNSNIKEDSVIPKFRVKYDKARIFDVNNMDITPDEITKGLFKGFTGVAMVELSGVYFLNKMFGCTWKIVQLKVYEPQRLQGFHFDLDESEDDNVKLDGFQFVTPD